MLKDKLFKLLYFISSGSLLLNTFIAPISVLAQETTTEPSPAETPIVQTTPELSEPEALQAGGQPTENTPELTPEVTPTEEITPELTPEVTPTEEVTPEPTLEATVTPEATPEPTSEVTDEETSTDENQEQIAATVIDTQTIFESDASDQLKDSTTNDNTSLQTDKADYTPGEVVIISGSGFDANTIYSIDIFSTGNYKFSDRVTSDESGGLFYTYQLDGTFRPQYDVVIKDASGNIVATTSFTDTEISSFMESVFASTSETIACMGDQPAAPDPINCTADDISLAQVRNITILDDGCMYPGDTVTFRADWEILSNATERYNVGLWFASEGQPNALYGKCSASTLPGTPDPFFEETNDTCGDIQGKTTGSISLEMTATCIAAPETNLLRLPYCTSWNQQEKENNGCSSPAQTAAGTPSKCNCDDGFTVPITVPPAIEVVKSLNPSTDIGKFDLFVNDTVVTDQGNGGTTGKVVVSTGSNSIGETAGTGTSLSEYSSGVSCVLRGTTTTVNTSGDNPWTLEVENGQDILCTITNTLETATLTLVKTVINDNGGTATESNFQAYIDSGAVSWNTPVTVNAGSHAASESTFPGYQAGLWGGDCAEDGTVSLNPGDNKTCTITNDDIAPKLTLVKTVINDNGGTKQVSDFSLYIDGTPATSGVAYEQTASSEITVSEDQLDGYVASDWGGDCSPDGKITLQPGDNKTCTITNNDEAATLIVKKIVHNNYGGTLEVDDFTFSVNGDTAIVFEADGQNDLTVNAGTYLVTEPAVPGYTTTYDNCSDLVIANGESATCTITNNDIQPKLYVIKVVDLSYGGTATPSDFSFSVTGNNASPSTFNGASAPGVLVSLNAGEYDVDETYSPPGYVSNESDNCAGSIDIGEEKTCTFTNSDTPATLIVIKHVINDDGGTSVAGDFTMHVTGNNVSQSTFPGSEAGTSITLNAGSYSVDEDSFAGYEKNLSSDCLGTIGVGDTKTCTVTNDDIPGSISGYKYAADEQTGLEGWTIKLYDCTGIDSFVIAQCVPAGSTVTDSSGFYKFEGLSAGKYIVMEELQGGWTIISPSNNQNNVTVSLNSESQNNNFINFENGYISGHKWNDLNGNGIWDSNEPALEGWTIKLDRPEGGDLVRTTDDNGYYYFGNLGPGNYSVFELSQAGWDQTAPDGDGKYYVDMVSQGSFPNRDFGNFKLGRVTACKVSDADGDIGTTEDQAPVENWIVSLLLDSQVSNTHATGEDGCYTWENLGSGHTYGVEEEVKPGWTSRNSESHDFGLITSGSDWKYTFINTQNGKIIVKKETNPTSAETFEFNASYGSGGFALSNGGQNDSGYLLPGTHSVSEVAKSGWDLTSATCDDGNNPSSVSLQAGEVVTCTFVNTQRGSITIIKDAIPNASLDFNFSRSFGYDFQLDDDSDPTLSNEIIFDNLTPGGYWVAEDFYTTWDLTDLYCTDPTQDTTVDLANRKANISISAGENVTCKFENTRKAEIKVDKVTSPSEDPQSFDFNIAGGPGSVDINFNLTDTADPYGTDHKLLPGSGYSVSENTPYGWDLTNVSCSNDDNPDNISLDPGESVTCTFTNTKRGEVDVLKYNDMNGNGVKESGEEVLSNWNIKLAGDSYGGEQLSDGNGLSTFLNLLPQGYTLSEDIQEGWIQTNIICDNGSYNSENNTYQLGVAPGSTVSCSIGNFELGKINACKYEDLTGNGIYDEGIDEPMEGISMILIKTDDPNWTRIVQETDTSCCTTFEGLKPGHYRVDEDQTDSDLDGFYSSNGVYSMEFDVTSGSIQTVNFLDARYREISGVKYEDLNNSGTRDEDEPGLSGWTIFIDYNNNDQLDASEPYTITDVNGYYVFSDLVADSYIIREVLQSGWIQTEPASGYYNIDGHVIVYSPDNNFGNFLPQPSISTVKSNIGPAEILVGETATFEITVENTGNVPLYNLEISDIFDTDYVDFVSSSPLSPSSAQEDIGADTGDYDGDGDTSEHIGLLSWDISSLAPGETITLTLYFLATAPTPDPVVATNGAQTVACAEDTSECSPEDTLTTEISLAHVDIDEITIELAKTNNRTSAISPGDGVTYALTVTNTGDVHIDSVIVIDVLPGGFKYVYGSTKYDGSPVGDPAIDGGQLTFDIGSLADGTQRVIEYQAQANGDVSIGTYINLAYCKGTAREVATVECNLVQSSVEIGPGQPSADVGGEVLGYVLPATGSETSLFILFTFMLIMGTLLRLLGFGLDNDWFTSEKIKKFGKKIMQITLILGLGFIVATKSAKAITNTVSIEDLPEYVTTDSFKLSYTALTDSSVTARFYVRKDGDGTWRNINGDISGASGQVQVDPKDIYNGDGRYYFRVEINGDSTFVDETNTLIDRGAPNPVSNYWKEKIAGGFYRLHWTTPDNDDFNRVLIYRSSETHFTADGSTKVGELGGAKNTDVTWDDVGLDSTKNYYYAVRAVDNAGNVSGIVADPETVTILGTSATTEGASEEVTSLPEEAAPSVSEEKGENVLGQETEVTPTPAKNIVQKAAQFAKDRTKITVGILAGLVIVGYFIYTRLYLKRK